MIRSFRIATLIAILVGLFASLNVTYASGTVIDHVFIADFNPDVDNGSYFAAMYTGDDTWEAIKITAVKQDHMEDDLAIDSNNYVISSTLKLDSPTFTTNHHRFTWAYLDDSDIGTIANVAQQTSYMSGTLNGDQAQFNGFVSNGATFILKEADAYSTNGLGWLVQNGNLLSYAVTNGETQVTHKLYISLILQ